MSKPTGVAPRYERLDTPETLERLRHAFRSMNRGMVLMWRLGLGRWAEAWPSVGGRVLVVEHLGRTSGTRYLTPLNFAREGRELFCLAAFGPGADWYRNVMKAGEAVLWLPDGRWSAPASDITDEPGARWRIRQVLIDSGFAARLFGLDPRTMTDDELDEATAAYRLIRFEQSTRIEPGYEDLLWMWVPIGGALTAAALAKLIRPR